MFLEIKSFISYLILYYEQSKRSFDRIFMIKERDKAIKERGVTMERDRILEQLQAQVRVNGHIVGAAVGCGMSAKYTVMGGADFLLALSAGKYRIMGRSSLASYLSYENNNEIVMNMGIRELFPIIKKVPILFGLFASDPQIALYEYLKEIKASGFSGIVNFPTISLIDGEFRKGLEEEGTTFFKEVEAIQLAHHLGMFTLAFVTNIEEAKMMIQAGADVICVHLGLTKGGYLGAKKYITMERARKITDEIFQCCDEWNQDILKMVYAGPANTPIDMQYLYQNTKCQGYIGGSTFDRLPAERSILNTVKAFKSNGNFEQSNPMLKMVTGELESGDYVDFIKKYIEEHYAIEIQLKELALVAHVSQSYLSTKFKREVGISFTEYLIRYRMNKAKEFLKEKISCKEVASKVGYLDYAQFSKIFKKYVGITPKEFQEKERVYEKIGKDFTM